MQGLFISRPMLHRGAYSIVLSRRITDDDGRFLGVVAGSIRFSYFHELFDRLNLDADDTITVLRRDRTIIMRKPFDLDVIGKNLATVPNLEPEQSEGQRIICRTGPGRCDTRGSTSGAPAPVRSMSWSASRSMRSFAFGSGK